MNRAVWGRFARMPRAELVKIARIGGLASVASERGHRWTPETARLASMKAAEKRRTHPARPVEG